MTDVKIKPGYKMTELGVIPEDWEIRRFYEIFDITAGGDVKKEYFSDIKTDEHKYPIFANAISNKGIYGYSSIYDYTFPSLTISARGGIGYAFPRYENYCAIVRLLVLQPKVDLSVTLVSDYVNKYLNFANESTGVPQLTKPQISQYYIIYPKPEEQKAIAQVLSDTDELISSLDELIEKKEKIKEGTMQELLTGKRRLPGFTGEWEEKKLKNTFTNITTGKLDANAMVQNGKYRFYTCAKEHYYIDNYIFDEEVLLISGNGENVGYVHYYKGKFNAYQRTYILLGFKDYIFFIKYYLDKYLKDRIFIEAKIGSTPYITKDTLTDMFVKIPTDINEQKAIAYVLSDMDSEIENLKEKREKYKQIKEGMMQELLTGKIRLV